MEDYGNTKKNLQAGHVHKAGWVSLKSRPLRGDFNIPVSFDNWFKFNHIVVKVGKSLRACGQILIRALSACVGMYTLELETLIGVIGQIFCGGGGGVSSELSILRFGEGGYFGFKWEVVGTKLKPKLCLLLSAKFAPERPKTR